jgi:hypothetical protein
MSADVQFLPQRNEDERPAVQVGDVLIFTYVDADGTVRVTVDTEDAERLVPVKININSGTIFDGLVG